MKQKIFTFLLIAAAGLTACKKLDNQPDIKAYDQQQINSYLSANNLTGFTEDNASGIHYKIIKPGSGILADTLKYSDSVSVVYTVKSVDGKYASSDTIVNHYSGYLGHLTTPDANSGYSLPLGLQTAIHDLLQYKNASMRLLLPSHLAYGMQGYGSGSSSNTTSRIAGNQSLDYYIHVIGKQTVYDELVIKNYITANNLTGYVKDDMGYYYKIVTQGTGIVGEIKEFSNMLTTYTGNLLNGVSFDSGSETTATTLTPYPLVTGVKDALMKHAATGTSISILLPSELGYGGDIRGNIPANSVLRFEFQIQSVTQP